jgi:SnoaL-like domain
MRITAGFVIVCLCATEAIGLAQAKQASPGAGTKKPGASPAERAAVNSPQALVREWFRRWNALDGTEEATKRLVDLYRPDAIHQTGPSERQIGPVYYEGHEAIRKLASDFVRTAEQIAFAIEKTPAGGKGVELFFVSDGPWDGPAVGVQYLSAYTDRKTKKRHAFPGFAVFHIEKGKIRYARFYTTREENRGE